MIENVGNEDTDIIKIVCDECDMQLDVKDNCYCKECYEQLESDLDNANAEISTLEGKVEDLEKQLGAE